ncbi:MAG: hypothetical protein R2729_07155 [Bryobacteraceae bacterium]
MTRTAPIPWWLWPNIAAVDAPVVALAWCALFASAAGVGVDLDAWAALGATVWSIYLADRALDGAGELPTLLPDRHRFWAGKEPLLLAAFAASLLLLGWFLLRAMSWGLLAAAVPAIGGVVSHLWIVHRMRWRPWPKEAAVGATFALGVPAPVVAASFKLTAPLAAACAVFGALCWLNCVVIEYGEWHAGLGGEPGPLVEACGRRAAPIGAALAIAAAALSFLFAPAWRPLFLAEAAAALLLAAAGARRWLDTTALAPCADLALFLPAVAAWLLR